MSRRLIDGRKGGKAKGDSKGYAKGGRPAKAELDPELVDKMIAVIRIGTPVVTAAAIAGIHRNTFREYIFRARAEPESVYGEFIRKVSLAVAEYEVRDLSIIDAHAHGRPAEYEMEVVRDSDGSVIKLPDGKPLMQIARDPDGKPIVKRSEIKSDWRAAMERLARRLPPSWGRYERLEVDPILNEQAPVEITPEKKKSNRVSKQEYDAVLRDVKRLIQIEEELGDPDEP